MMTFKEEWNKKTLEDQEYVIKSAALTVSQVAMYFLLKKMGAPKWAAFGLSNVSVNAAFAPYKFAYDQRQIANKRVEALAKKMEDDIRAELDRERKRRRAQNQ